MTPVEAFNKASKSSKRLPGLESIIQQDDCWSYWYAHDVLRCRWPEAESVIQQDALYAHLYAREIIKGRWPEAEETISKSTEWAYYYAIDLIKDRWIKAEETIAQGDLKLKYISRFFSEPVVAKDPYSDYEWEIAGAVGFFAPRRLFEIERKVSLIDMMMIDNLPQC